MTQIQTTAEWWYLGAGGVPMQPVLVQDFSLISNRIRSFNMDLPLSPPNTYIASLYAIAVCLLRLKIKYLVNPVINKTISTSISNQYIINNAYFTLEQNTQTNKTENNKT